MRNKPQMVHREDWKISQITYDSPEKIDLDFISLNQKRWLFWKEFLLHMHVDPNSDPATR